MRPERLQTQPDLSGPQSPRPPRRFGAGRAVALVLAGIVVAIALLGLAGLTGLRIPWFANPFGTREVDRSQPTLLKAIEDLSVYKAASGNFQVLVDLEKDTKLVPAAIKGERTLFVAAGTVDAEVDFTRLGKDAIKVSPDGKSATVTLPHAYLTRARVDPERSYVASRQRGLVDRLLSAFRDSPTSERELYLVAEDKLEGAAAQSDLVNRAEANTRAMLVGMLRSLGYTEVTVTFSGTVGGQQ